MPEKLCTKSRKKMLEKCQICEKSYIGNADYRLANIHMDFIKLCRTKYKSQSIIFKCTHIFTRRKVTNTERVQKSIRFQQKVNEKEKKDRNGMKNQQAKAAISKIKQTPNTVVGIKEGDYDESVKYPVYCATIGKM